MAKVARFLLGLIFLFTLFVIPVQAQAAGETGFLPLVTQADPAVPLAVQAHQAFDRLLPDLLAAQSSGAILSFKPDFSAGLLRIAYAPGARGLAPARVQGLASIHAAMALVPHAQPAGVQRWNSITPTFSAFLYSSCFSASLLAVSSHVIGSLRDTTGHVVGTYAGDADSSGMLSDCFDTSSDITQIVPGYKMTFTVYDSTMLWLGTFSAFVPRIAITSFNKTTSVVTGLGPKNKAFGASLYHPYLNAAETSIALLKNGILPASGSWAVDFGTLKFRGGDYFTLWESQNSSFEFGRDFYIPYLECNPGSNHCRVWGFPFKPASLTIIHGGVAHTFTGKFNSSNYFEAFLDDGAGTPILLKAGDKVSATGAITYTLPGLTAVPNFMTSVVTGKAPAGRYFNVWVKDVTNNIWYSKWSHSNSAGSYSADFSSSLTLSAGTPLVYYIGYTDPATGNVSGRYITAGP